MASRLLYRCIICGYEAADRPPRHCPRCGVPAAKFRLVVDRPPEQPPKEEPKKEEAAAS